MHKFRGFASLSSVIASLEQRYLNGFVVDEEEEVVLVASHEDASASAPAATGGGTSATKKKPRSKSKKLKATKEEEELMMDGEGFIDDSEVIEYEDHDAAAATTAAAALVPPSSSTPAAAVVAAAVDLSKLVVVQTRELKPLQPHAAATTTTAAAAPYSSRSQFLIHHLGEFNGNAHVCECMSQLSHCLVEEELSNSNSGGGGAFVFSPEVEALLLQVDDAFRKQQPVRTKGYLAHLLSVFPSQVSREVLVARLQCLLLKRTLDRREQLVDKRIKWAVDALLQQQGELLTGGQSRSCVFLVGDACRKAKRARDRLEVWLVERRTELAEFSVLRRKLKPRAVPYATYALDKMVAAVSSKGKLDRGELKRAMDRFPEPHHFWDAKAGQYVAFKNPDVEAANALAVAAAASAAVAAAAAALAEDKKDAVVHNNVATAPTAVAPPGTSSTTASIREVFAPYKTTRYQRVTDFNPQDFVLKQQPSAPPTTSDAPPA